MSIKLRDVVLEDASVIYKWKTDPYITQMALDYGYKTNIAEQEHDINKALKSIFKEYKIIENDGRPIGYIRIDWMDTNHRFAWIRFALGEDRGFGYSKEALQLYIDDLFNRGCKRIEGEIYEYNIPSIKVVEQLGFTKEGVKRKAHFNGSDYCSILVYGLLDEDYKK